MKNLINHESNNLLLMKLSRKYIYNLHQLKYKVYQV